MNPLFVACLAFALVATSGTLWFLRIARVRIPVDRRGFVAAWIAGALLALFAFAKGAGWLAGAAAGLALLGSAFFLLTVAVSRQRVAAGAVKVGDTLPAFRAPDEHGVLFDSAALAGRPVLLKFFRAHW